MEQNGGHGALALQVGFVPSNPGQSNLKCMPRLTGYKAGCLMIGPKHISY